MVCIGPHCRHLSISGYEESSSTRWPHPTLLFHLSLHHTLNRLFICLKYHRLLWLNLHPPPLSPKFLLWLGWMAQGAPAPTLVPRWISLLSSLVIPCLKTVLTRLRTSHLKIDFWKNNWYLIRVLLSKMVKVLSSRV